MTTPTPPTAAGRLRTVATWVMAAIVTGAAIWIGVAAWRIGGTASRPPIAAAPSGATDRARQPDPFGTLLAGRTPGDLLMNAGAKPLETNPAGLAAPPNGQRLTAYTMRDEGLVEEVAVWSIAGDDLPAATKFFDEAAAARGYATVAVGPSATAGAINRVYRQPNQPDRTLTIRLARREQAIRVVLHLRYTMPDPSAHD